MLTIRSTGFRLGAVCLLLLSGCVDPSDTGSTSGTSLYLFDGAAGKVLVFDDLDAQLAKTPAPTRTLSGALVEKVKELAWGGMVVDELNNRLYLISKAGDVLKIDRLRSQNGAITSTLDTTTFRLGDTSSRLNGGSFYQASLDRQSGVLYVMESNDSDARVWQVNAPGTVTEGAVVPPTTLQNPGGDKNGSGLAVGPGGVVYAFFNDGSNVITPSNERLTGPRLRVGASSGFQANGNVILGSNTGLAAYGALALDAGNNRLFCARHLVDSQVTGASVLVFRTGQFTQSYNQAPEGSVGSSAQAQIRLLAHAGNKDWLAASTSTGDKGTGTVYLWSDPIKNGTPVTLEAGAGIVVRGIALDGSN